MGHFLVNCTDDQHKEAISVLTKSDLPVVVDIRVTYSARCDAAGVVKILETVSTSPNANPPGSVQPDQLYERYIMPIIKQSVRDKLAGVSMEQVKEERQAIQTKVAEDLDNVIQSEEYPVDIKLVVVSNMQLPVEVTEMNKKIELQRQEKEREIELKEAVRMRLGRQQFEAEQEREIAKVRAEQEKDVAKIKAEQEKQVLVIDAEAARDALLLQAEAERDARLLEAQGIQSLSGALNPSYLKYLEMLEYTKRLESMSSAISVSTGSVWYLGDRDFVIPPGSNTGVSVPVR